MMKRMTTKNNNVTNMSTVLLVLLLAILIISLGFLYFAVDLIVVQQNEDLNSYSFLAIGFLGLAISIYYLTQTRGTTTKATLELPRVLTTLECPKCDFKNIRDFERGDYIFKETDSCQKCEEKMKITAIYREPKKKK